MAENQRKLLIVEDDKYYSHTLKLKFDTLGYDVRLAENGEKMFLVLETFQPDLILLDLVMPVMNGFEALERLKTEGRVKSKVVVLSNLGQEEDIDRAKKLGADSYVIKTNASIQEVVEMAAKFTQ